MTVLRQSPNENELKEIAAAQSQLNIEPQRDLSNGQSLQSVENQLPSNPNPMGTVKEKPIGEFYATQKLPYEVRQAAAFENIPWDSNPVPIPSIDPVKARTSETKFAPLPARAIDSLSIRNLPKPGKATSLIPLETDSAKQSDYARLIEIDDPTESNSKQPEARYPLALAAAASPVTSGAEPLPQSDDVLSAALSFDDPPPPKPPTQQLLTKSSDFNSLLEDFQPEVAKPTLGKANENTNEFSSLSESTKSTERQNFQQPIEEAKEKENLPKPVLNLQPGIKKDDNDFRVASVPSSPKPSQPAEPAAKKTSKDKTPHVLLGAENFVLAEQPQTGDQWKDDRPIVDPRAALVTQGTHGFSPDPIDPYLPYDPYQQMQVYQGKTLFSNQRPILELGRPWYQLGQLSPGYSWFGKHNNITPQFLLYGDVRTAAASSNQNGNSTTQIAFEANLDFDLKVTSTERFHMFMSPLDGGGRNTRWLLDDNRFVDETDADIDFGYFEGDLGAMVGGFTNKTLPFDLPFAIGVMPLLLQNGVWMEDAFLGVAATIPARNSPKFSISNMDITFFAGYDKIDSPAFPGDDSAARMYGMAAFIEAANGYFEVDYAFLDDRTFDDRSYHNIGLGFTRRYGRLISNSTRIIVNAGQDSSQVANTADGVLLLSENSLITSSPSTLVPYANFFAGFDRPQSAARANAAGGVLRNTGILFESDGITNFPTLDATGNDTVGGALGLNILGDDFSQQLVVEMAMLGVMNADANRNAPGPQYGVGARYQLPLTNAIIFRMDGMYGFLEDQEDVNGVRLELRHKY